MAVLIPRTVLICAIPSLVVLLTLVWLKKRKQKEDTTSSQTASSSKEDSVPSPSSSSEVRTETCGGGTGEGHGVGGGRVPGWEEKVEEDDRRNLIGTEIVFPTAEVAPPCSPSRSDQEDEEDLLPRRVTVSRQERSPGEELPSSAVETPEEEEEEEELQGREVEEGTAKLIVEGATEKWVSVDQDHSEEDCTDGQDTVNKDTLGEFGSSDRNIVEVESVPIEEVVQEVIQEVSHCLEEECQDFESRGESGTLLRKGNVLESPQTIVPDLKDSEELRQSPVGSPAGSSESHCCEEQNLDLSSAVVEDCEQVDCSNGDLELVVVSEETPDLDIPERTLGESKEDPDGQELNSLPETDTSIREEDSEIGRGQEVSAVELIPGEHPEEEDIKVLEELEVTEEKYLDAQEHSSVDRVAQEESPIVAAVIGSEWMESEIDSESEKVDVDHVDDQVEAVTVDDREASEDAESPREESSSQESVKVLVETTTEGSIGHLVAESVESSDMRQKDTTACKVAQCAVASEKESKEVMELEEAVERLHVGSETPEPEPEHNPEPVSGHHKPRKGKCEMMSNGGTNTSAYGSASHSPTEEMLESSTVSNYSDLHSEGSSDSGNGGSEIHLPLLLEATAVAGNNNHHHHQGGNMAQDQDTVPREVTPVPLLQFYEFELPQTLCGRLIGQGGRFVKLIKAKTHANISIKNHPISEYVKLCTVIGTSEDITAALAMIRRKFPENRYPDVTLLPVSLPICGSFAVPETLQLQLPEGIVCDVVLSSMVNAGHFFLQQPTHPTYPSLSRLDQFMLACYMSAGTTPEVPRPIEAGFICAAPMMGGWYRSQVVNVYADTDECDVKFVDYGGFARVANSSLHQIRSDFMTLPFQASECYLANVAPVDDAEGWTLEACGAFEELAQGQILQSQIVSYTAEGIPCVHLFRIQGAATTFINRELVNNGLAVWVENEE